MIKKMTTVQVTNKNVEWGKSETFIYAIKKKVEIPLLVFHIFRVYTKERELKKKIHSGNYPLNIFCCVLCRRIRRL